MCKDMKNRKYHWYPLAGTPLIWPPTVKSFAGPC